MDAYILLMGLTFYGMALIKITFIVIFFFTAFQYSAIITGLVLNERGYYRRYFLAPL